MYLSLTEKLEQEILFQIAFPQTEYFIGYSQKNVWSLGNAYLKSVSSTAEKRVLTGNQTAFLFTQDSFISQQYREFFSV